MINRAILTGRLTRDVDLRYTQSGRAVASFTLAVDRRFTDSNGQRQADFINCVVWGKSAESFANFMHKGSLVGIDGTIQTRNYENKQGQRVYVTEINVDNWSFLEPRNANNRNNGNYNDGNYNNGNSNYGNNNYGNGNYNRNNNGNSYNNAPTGNQNDDFGPGGDHAPQGNDHDFGPKPNQGNHENPNPKKDDGNNEDPFKGKGDKIDISDDDLPF